jgi:hypothetical protein
MLCYTTSDRCVSSSCTFPWCNWIHATYWACLDIKTWIRAVEELTVSMINYFDEVCLQFSITSLCPSNWKNAFEVNFYCVYIWIHDQNTPPLSQLVSNTYQDHNNSCRVMFLVVLAVLCGEDYTSLCLHNGVDLLTCFQPTTDYQILFGYKEWNCTQLHFLCSLPPFFLCSSVLQLVPSIGASEELNKLYL